MVTFDVVDLFHSKISEIELSDKVFAARQNANLIYEAVKMQQSNRRAGTVAVKNTSLVVGGGKKPWKQKGTGRARQGSIRASQWVGGGKAMGPKLRDYTYRPPRSVRRAALAAILSQRTSEKTLIIVNEFPSDGTTKQAEKSLKKGLKLTSALIVDAKKNTKLHLAIRNLKTFDILPPEGLNVESIMRRQNLVFTLDAAKTINDVLLKPRGKSRQAAETERANARTY